jgi:hypothetical protein
MVSEGAHESDLAGSEPAAGVEGGSKDKPESAPQGDSSLDQNPSGKSPEQPPPQVDGLMPPPRPPGKESAVWPDRLAALTASFYGWLSRPRVRLTVTGVILLLIGGLFMNNSVWTLPLVIVGALMVVIAWVGCRLDGRLAIEWGEAGTQLEFRAKIRPAQPAQPALPGAPEGSRQPARTAGPETEHTETIDGEAHTVEIDLAELEALIAAVETAKGQIAHTGAAPVATRNLRVAQDGGRSSEAAG